MKRLNLIVSGAVALAALAPSVPAQFLKPIDPTKRADDINNKSVDFGDVNFQTLSPGMHGTTSSPLSGKKANFNDVSLSGVKLKSLNLSEIPMRTLPQQNFTAKRAALPDKIPPQKQLGVIDSRAPITNRQIRAFMPGGEEQLKQQLNTPR